MFSWYFDAGPTHRKVICHSFSRGVLASFLLHFKRPTYCNKCHCLRHLGQKLHAQISSLWPLSFSLNSGAEEKYCIHANIWGKKKQPLFDTPNCYIPHIISPLIHTHTHTRDSNNSQLHLSFWLGGLGKNKKGSETEKDEVQGEWEKKASKSSPELRMLWIFPRP